jgi:hypothetical protein
MISIWAVARCDLPQRPRCFRAAFRAAQAAKRPWREILGGPGARIAYIEGASRPAIGRDIQRGGVARAWCRFAADAIALSIDADYFARLPVLEDRNWPAQL